MLLAQLLGTLYEEMTRARERSPSRGRTRRNDRVDRAPIWARPEPGTRRPSLSRELIASTALEIADHEGFEQVSMRRIAEKLGAGTMTLYHYLRTKDELIALMDDAIMGEALVPEGEMPSDWREALAAIARRSRDAFLRHSWAFYALQGARMGPNGLRHVEQSMAAVANAPLDEANKVALCGVIDDFVIGFVLRSIEEPSELLADPSAIDELVRAHIATGQFPHMAAFVGDATPCEAFARALTWMGSGARFEFGLQALLEAVVAKRRILHAEPRDPKRRGSNS
jgi:AcrR family transcriptional regulator